MKNLKHLVVGLKVATAIFLLTLTLSFSIGFGIGFIDKGAQVTNDLKLYFSQISAATSPFPSAQAATTIHVPNSFLYDAIRGQIVIGTDTIKCALAPSTYTYSATHAKRSDVTEIGASTGYTAGGQTATAAAVINTGPNRVTVTITPAVWSGATTITARQVYCYKARGGASSADELVAFGDFGVDVSSSGGTYTVGAIVLEYTGF